MFPPTDSAKSALDMFPITDCLKDIHSILSGHVEVVTHSAQEVENRNAEYKETIKFILALNRPNLRRPFTPILCHSTASDNASRLVTLSRSQDI